METKNIPDTSSKPVTSIAKHVMESTLLPCPSAGMKCPCGGCSQKYGGVCLRPKPCIICDKDLLRVRRVDSQFKI